MERRFLTKNQLAELLRNNPSDNIYESQIKHWYLIYGNKIEIEESEDEEDYDEARDEDVQDSEGNR